MSEEQKVTAEETAAPEEVKEAPAPEAPAPEAKAPEVAVEVPVEVPAKFKKFVEEIENLTALELNELVKVFEQKFGVSAAAVAVAGSGAGEPAEEKTDFDVELTDGGAQKIQVIKVVKEVLGLGLKEAKDLVDGAPAMLKEGMKKDAAEELKKKIEDVGGKVTLK